MYPLCPVTSTLIRLSPPSLGPDFPGRLAALPQLVEQHLLSQRIHALPEIMMAESHQLAVGGETLQRLTLEVSLVAVDVVEHTRFEHEERAVDPPLPELRLLRELHDPVAVELEVPETGGRSHGSQRRELA